VSKKIRPTPTFIPATATLTLLWGGLIALAYWLSPRDAALTWIICLTGNIVGIPLGMISSPLEREGTHFRVMGGWIATFASGYLLSKFDDLDVNSLVQNDLHAGRMLLFLAFLILGAVQTFVLRSYLDPSRTKDYYLAGEDEPSAAPAHPPQPAA